MASWNLADLLEGNADRFPERLAVATDRRELTFGQLDERATRLANHWRSLGVGPDQHVGLYLYNRPEYLEAMLAAFKLRAVPINLNYRYVASELRYLIENAELVGILHEPELGSVVDEALAGGARSPFRMEVGPGYDRALAAASPRRDFPARSGDDRFVVYTGGTTGMPRGVEWRHEDLFFAGLQGGNPGGDPFASPEALWEQVTANGSGLNVHAAPPMIHGSATLASWIAMLNGGTAILVEGRSYDPARSLDVAARYRAHTMKVVGDAMALPLADALEADASRWDLSELMVLASAGAVLSTSVRERLERALPTTMIMNNFGASETGHQGTAFYEEGKAIWLMDERHTCVLDANFDRLPPGSPEVGRLARFGHVPLGYYKDPEKTAATFVTKDGVRYVIPGDQAMVAADGSIVFLGRGSAVINTGGEKVYAEEVEDALKGHPAVFDAVVVGVPDERWGQRVEALVTLRSAAEPTAIEAYVRTRVAGYKTPRRIWVVDDLHRQPSGKPDYPWARARAVELGGAA